MIKKLNLYALTCDGCGKKCGSADVAGYPDRISLYQAAELAEWRQLKGRWYCPDCYEVDENDNYVPIVPQHHANSIS